jgi:hypothetical protein
MLYTILSSARMDLWINLTRYKLDGSPEASYEIKDRTLHGSDILCQNKDPIRCTGVTHFPDLRHGLCRKRLIESHREVIVYRGRHSVTSTTSV